MDVRPRKGAVAQANLSGTKGPFGHTLLETATGIGSFAAGKLDTVPLNRHGLTQLPQFGVCHGHECNDLTGFEWLDTQVLLAPIRSLFLSRKLASSVHKFSSTASSSTSSSFSSNPDKYDCGTEDKSSTRNSNLRAFAFSFDPSFLSLSLSLSLSRKSTRTSYLPQPGNGFFLKPDVNQHKYKRNE